jgi:hypothetical protein
MISSGFIGDTGERIEFKLGKLPGPVEETPAFRGLYKPCGVKVPAAGGVG